MPRFLARLFPMSAGLAMLAGLLVCLPAALAQQKPAPQPVDGKIEWVYSYEEGQRLAKETGKPMFIVFRCER